MDLSGYCSMDKYAHTYKTNMGDTAVVVTFLLHEPLPVRCTFLINAELVQKPIISPAKFAEKNSRTTFQTPSLVFFLFAPPKLSHTHTDSIQR